MLQITRIICMVISGIVPVWQFAKLHMAQHAGITTGAFPWFFGRGVAGVEDAALFAGGVVALFWLMTTGKVLIDRY